MAIQSSIPGRAQLTGRRRECDALNELVQAVRAGGESRVLVVRGEAGVGKTALLSRSPSRRRAVVSRAAGVQSEMELAFAGLHQLLAPMLDRLERLPVPQRDALRTAFGVSPGSVPDRFLIGVAVLSLLSVVGLASRAQPLSGQLALPGVGGAGRITCNGWRGTLCSCTASPGCPGRGPAPASQGRRGCCSTPRER